MKAERSVNIDRPTAEVFAFLARLENHVLFVPGLLELRAPGGVGPGAEAVGVRRAFGAVRTLPYRVTRYIPNEALALSGRLGPLEGTVEYRLATAPDGRTNVTMINDFRARRPFGVLGPVLDRMAGRDAQIVTANLKRTLEAPRQ